jgi:hypothetical protein
MSQIITPNTYQPSRTASTPIHDNRGYAKHREQIAFFNDLIIDLKKQALGHEPGKPIDMPRLDQASRHVAELFQCRVTGCCGR